MIMRNRIYRHGEACMSNSKTYSELIQLPTYIDRYRYLKLGGRVGEDTFGFDRYLNQVLYRSNEWKRFRREIIVRDEGRDLACVGYEITGKILVHHIDPITIDDVNNRASKIFDPENVICVSHNTHNAIHYGDENLLITEPVIRKPNDTCPWKR